jgi:hypothetical protein
MPKAIEPPTTSRRAALSSFGLAAIAAGLAVPAAANTDADAELIRLCAEAARCEDYLRKIDWCAFRRSQPSIPIETSHLFRLKPARHSDGSLPGWHGLRATTFGSGASRLVKPGCFRGTQFAQ